MAGFALGAGLIISALTTKYRDLSFLITFGVQLLMYASPIIYSSTTIPLRFQFYVQLNPLSSIIESFRNAYLGVNNVHSFSLSYSSLFMIILLIIGLFVFNKVEQKFIDTV
jgi:lipopolysaccharide transport system permease protein